MSRRGWAGRLAVLVIAAGGLAALWWTQRAPAYVLEQNADQNVLLITIDTLRADALGSYGGLAATPTLDALASHGARFTFAHSHAVVTLPSHTSILTGRLPYEHGMRDNSGFRVKDGTETLGSLISDETSDTPERVAEKAGERESLCAALGSLAPREVIVLRERFGLDDGVERTLEEVGASLGLTRERIRQIQNRALAKLRRRLMSLQARGAGSWESLGQ